VVVYVVLNYLKTDRTLPRRDRLPTHKPERCSLYFIGLVLLNIFHFREFNN